MLSRARQCPGRARACTGVYGRVEACTGVQGRARGVHGRARFTIVGPPKAPLLSPEGGIYRVKAAYEKGPPLVSFY